MKGEIDVYEVQPQELMFGLIEVIRETQERIGYYELKKITKDHLDNSIAETIKKQERKLSESEIVAMAAKLYTKIMTKGAIQALSLLTEYYAEAKNMKRDQFLNEPHKPARLSRHIKCTGYQRPPNVAAHAIVSGDHPAAKAARKILAKWKIRVDDPDNGVFLPADSRYMPHPEMPDASNHAQLHTDEYYVNITNILNTATSQAECRLALRLIASKLKEGSLEY